MHFDFVLEVPVDVVLPECGTLRSALAGGFVDDDVDFDVLALIGGGAVEPDCVFKVITFAVVFVRVGF
jgi:hypothetical protein